LKYYDIFKLTMRFMVRIIPILVLLLATCMAQIREKGATEKGFCLKVKKKFHVVPGEHFGTLNEDLVDKWLQLNCDQYFCQPHKNSVKDIFKCVPLEDQPRLAEKESSLAKEESSLARRNDDW
jgi:hypothetical protein